MPSSFYKLGNMDTSETLASPTHQEASHSAAVPTASMAEAGSGSGSTNNSSRQPEPDAETVVCISPDLQQQQQQQHLHDHQQMSSSDEAVQCVPAVNSNDVPAVNDTRATEQEEARIVAATSSSSSQSRGSTDRNGNPIQLPQPHPQSATDTVTATATATATAATEPASLLPTTPLPAPTSLSPTTSTSQQQQQPLRQNSMVRTPRHSMSQQQQQQQQQQPTPVTPLRLQAHGAQRPASTQSGRPGFFKSLFLCCTGSFPFVRPANSYQAHLDAIDDHPTTAAPASHATPTGVSEDDPQQQQQQQQQPEDSTPVKQEQQQQPEQHQEVEQQTVGSATQEAPSTAAASSDADEAAEPHQSTERGPQPAAAVAAAAAAAAAAAVAAVEEEESTVRPSAPALIDSGTSTPAQLSQPHDTVEAIPLPEATGSAEETSQDPEVNGDIEGSTSAAESSSATTATPVTTIDTSERGLAEIDAVPEPANSHNDDDAGDASVSGLLISSDSSSTPGIFSTATPPTPTVMHTLPHIHPTGTQQPVAPPVPMSLITLDADAAAAALTAASTSTVADEEEEALAAEVFSPHSQLDPSVLVSMAYPGAETATPSERSFTDWNTYHNDQALLPPLEKRDERKMCLVLDLDETLVHSSFKPTENPDFTVPVELDGIIHTVYVQKRPGVDQFLLDVAQHFEVVIFTASIPKYADPVLDILDPHRVIRHRLFRDSCSIHYGNYVKDLNRLGRSLRRIIILDNSPASYYLHPNNAVPVTTWFHDMHDTELMDLVPFLTELKDVDDVMLTLELRELKLNEVGSRDYVIYTHTAERY